MDQNLAYTELTVLPQKDLPAVNFRTKFALFTPCNLDELGVNSIISISKLKSS